MDGLCLNPLFLRILYLSNIFLNILRFVVPILLIIRVILDIYKQVINPNDEEGKKHIKNRVIACIIIFLVPTITGVFFSLIEGVIGNNYSDLAVCREFANLDYITTIEEQREQQELDLYLSEREQNLSSYEKKIEAIRKIVESNKVSQGIGEYANNENMIACGSGSQYNTGLFNAVRSAGYKTREGVVAAASYLSSYINVHIPYFWSGGHTSSANTLIGVSDQWGCDKKMSGKGTDLQKPGNSYPYGLDCSGFVNWAIMNGGYYTGTGKQSAIPSTDSIVFSSLEGFTLPSVSVDKAKGQIKPGDIAFKSGHVGMVVEVNDSSFKVAEEKGYKHGLKVTEHEYKIKEYGFTNIVLMDNFYNNYQKGVALWNGFK